MLVQVTSWPAAPQLHPAPVAETNASPVASVSCSVVVPLMAVLPVLLTCSV